MAATLEAGDRARSDVPHGDTRIFTPQHYAKEAENLYKAVEDIEYPKTSVDIDPPRSHTFGE